MTDLPIPAICACLDAEARAVFWVTVICHNCGGEFQVAPNSASKTKFCRRPDCRKAYQREQYARLKRKKRQAHIGRGRMW